MPNAQPQQWQQDFERAFVSFIQTKTKEKLRTGIDAFRVYEALGEKQIGPIWVSLSSILRVSPKKLHDFYHNSFSKRYYSDFALVRDEAVKYFEETKLLGAKECVRHVIDSLRRAHEGEDYHFQTVYQFCLYRLRRCNTKKQGTPDQSSSQPKESEDSGRVDIASKQSFLFDVFDAPQTQSAVPRSAEPPSLDLECFTAFGQPYWDFE